MKISPPPSSLSTSKPSPGNSPLIPSQRNPSKTLKWSLSCFMCVIQSHFVNYLKIWFEVQLNYNLTNICFWALGSVEHDKSKLKSLMHDVFITVLLYVSLPTQYPSKESHHQMDYLLYKSVIVQFSWWHKWSLVEQLLPSWKTFMWWFHNLEVFSEKVWIILEKS